MNEPTICVTYNIRPDPELDLNFAEDVTFWVEDTHHDSFKILNATMNLMNNVIYYTGKPLEEIKERDIYIQYQKLFAREFWHNYETKSERFKTKKLAKMRKPHRNFTSVTKEYLNEQIEKTLFRKEENE